MKISWGTVADWFTAVALAVGIIFAAFQLVNGLSEYKTTQKWKRAEITTTLLTKLDSDPELRLGLELLDWKHGEFPLPDRYKGAIQPPILKHNWGKLSEALDPDKDEFSKDEVIYTLIFDRLFNYFEEINYYVEQELLTIADVGRVCFWVDKLYEPEYADNKDVFRNYLGRFSFDDVPKLANRCKPGTTK